jgi:predicted transcriptional regulator
MPHLAKASAKKDIRITVSLTERDHRELSAIADRCDVSISRMTRQAITEFLDRSRKSASNFSEIVARNKRAAND